MSDLNNTSGRLSADILAIQGSPRRGGNTDRLLDAALESAGRLGVSHEKIMLRDFKISPCLEINQCMETGHCAIQDDMTGLYSKLTAAPVVLAATPVFFYGPSAQLKTFIDRCQALWARKYILKQSPGPRRARGYLISAAATGGKKLFDGLLMTTRYFFDVLEIEFAGELLVRGVDEAGAVLDKAEAMEQARALGREMAEFIKIRNS